MARKKIGNFTDDGYYAGGDTWNLGRHILDFEDSYLTLPELRLKYRAAKEGHDDDLAEIVSRDILRRTHSR